MANSFLLTGEPRFFRGRLFADLGQANPPVD
jgi:hypothetical protein